MVRAGLARFSWIALVCWGAVLLVPAAAAAQSSDDKLTRIAEETARVKRDLLLEGLELEIEIARDIYGEARPQRDSIYYPLLSYSDKIRLRYSEKDGLILVAVEMKNWVKGHKDRKFLMDKVAETLAVMLEKECPGGESAWKRKLHLDYYHTGLKEKIGEWAGGKLKGLK